jgi:hypothetical protein
VRDGVGAEQQRLHGHAGERDHPPQCEPLANFECKPRLARRLLGSGQHCPRAAHSEDEVGDGGGPVRRRTDREGRRR